MSEEETSLIWIGGIIGGVVVGVIMLVITKGLGIISHSKSKKVIRESIKNELQRYSDFIEKIKDELDSQDDSIISIRTSKLVEETKKIIDKKTSAFFIRDFHKLSIPEKESFKENTLNQLEAIYKKISDHTFNIQNGRCKTMRGDLLKLKTDIDSTIKMLEDG